jgi:hypothetical protein
VFITAKNFTKVDSEFISYIYKVAPLLLSFFGSFFAIIIYVFNLNLFFKSKQNKFTLGFFNFLVKKWYFDKFYNEVFGLKFLNLSYVFFYKDIDRGLLEFFGPLTIVKGIQKKALKMETIKPFFFLQTLSFFLIFFFYALACLFNFITLYSMLTPLFLIIAINTNEK